MQHRTRVKFCGITRLRDAQQAIELGVDALGFIFHPDSPRFIDAEHAAEIIRELPAFVTTVGLVVDRPATEVNEIISRTYVDIVQCHGDESNSDCEALNRPFIKALRVKSDTDIAALSSNYPLAKGILLDAYVPGVPGGSGQSFDWQQAKHVDDKRLILAGGLTTSNVADAIRQVRPFAVDVSSGIESAPGIKDEQKMINFIENVRLADGKH